MVEEICKHCKHCLSCICGDEFKTCYLKKTPHERAKVVLAQYTKQPTAIDLYSKDEVLEMLVKFATEQDLISRADERKKVIGEVCKAFCEVYAANDTCPDNHNYKVIEHVKKAMEESHGE